MARFGVSIEKSISYRGAAQPFANVYHYEGGLTPSANVSLENMLDQLVTKEKAIHSTAVAFLRGRVWSTGLGQSENNMIVDKALSGTGAETPHTIMDRERAFLVRFRAGTDSRGRPVYLRKWWHLDLNLVASTAISNAMLQQTAEMTTAQRAALVAIADGFKQLTVAGTPMNLVSQQGRPISGSTTAHRFLEHHQLGDEWRTI